MAQPSQGGRIAWPQSLGTGLLVGLSLGCFLLAKWTGQIVNRILLVGAGTVLLLLALAVMLQSGDGGGWGDRLERRLEFRFTAAGIPFFAAMVVLTLAAFSSGNNLVYLVVAGLLAALLVSGLTSALDLSGMVLQFRLPDEIFAGHSVPIEFTLTNEKSFWPAYSLTVRAECNKGKDRNPPAVVPPGSRAEMRPVYFPYLPRKHSVTVDSEISFPQRGRYTSTSFSVSTRFPFALVNKRRRFHGNPANDSEVLVYPRPASGEWLPDLVPQHGALWERYQRGSGQELYRLRPHVPGDSARTVHWKASARAGELRVREFCHEGAWQVRLRFAMPPGVSAHTAETAVSFCTGMVLQLAESDVWLEFHGEHAIDRGEQRLYLPLAPAAIHRRNILDYLAVVDPRSPSQPLAEQADAEPDLFEVSVFDAVAEASVSIA